MRKISAIALVVSFVFCASVSAQINPIPLVGADALGDSTLTIVYDPAGSWHTDYAGDATLITTFELVSSIDFFAGPDPAWKVGLFDVYNSKKAFKLDPAGFGALQPGGEAVAGISAADLSNALEINGSFAGGGALQPVDLYVIPEPTSIVLLGLGGLALLARRRK